MKVNITLDQSRNRQKGHPIVINIFISKSDRCYPSINLFSFAEHWDFEKEEPKKSHPNYSVVIEKILDIKFKINKLQKSNLKRTSLQIKNYIFGKDGDVYDFWETRIAEEKKKLENKSKVLKTKGNAGVYQYNLNVWKEYKPTLSFEEITYEFLTKFKIEKSATCSASGINTYLSKLKAIYNEAVRRGIYKNEGTYPFTRIMEKEKPTKDKYFTSDEMKTLLKSSSKSVHYKYFMLCFYLGGLDFIDIATLRKSDIKNGRIKKMRAKGNTQEVINNKIFPEAKKIIDFFHEEDSLFILPIHKYDYETYRKNYVERIRKAVSQCNIFSHVDSKTPRYTFIHIGSMELYQNRDIIKELVGHSQGDTLSIYEGKFPVKIKDEVHRKIIDAVLDDINEFPSEEGEFSDLA